MATTGSMTGNGLSSFSLHRSDADQAATMAALQQEGLAAGFGVGLATAGDVDPEAAARQHLKMALASESAPTAIAPDVADLELEFKCLGTQTLALTGTKTVKFRQVYNKVPVYGSLVTVELDEQNELLGINSAMGTPEGVSPVANIAPAAALERVREAGGDPASNAVGRIIFYFDRQSEAPAWRLCYLFEDVPLSPDGREQVEAIDGSDPIGLASHIEDFIVDAHSGDLVARLPRAADATETAPDELGAQRQISVAPGPGGSTMIDSSLNVQTFDLAGADLDRDYDQRRLCANPPPPWSRGAVSAHANAAVVAGFVRDVLKRRGLDNQGSPFISTVNCTFWQQGPGNGEWYNAMWSQGQMFYGQRRVAGRLISTAADLDVVAHEITHGLTQNTANINYSGQSGALNESYSDIFGVIVANFGSADPTAWDYRIGKTFKGTGVPLRDLGDPALRGQPAHMNDYRNLPLTRSGDWGGVHTNSGIHNKAAHGIMTATTGGSALFSPEDLAALFFIALTEHLSRTSLFADSRRGVEAAALTYFRNRTQVEIDERVAAIRTAFEAVGIA